MNKYSSLKQRRERGALPIPFLINTEAKEEDMIWDGERSFPVTKGSQLDQSYCWNILILGWININLNWQIKCEEWEFHVVNEF